MHVNIIGWTDDSVGKVLIDEHEDLVQIPGTHIKARHDGGYL